MVFFNQEYYHPMDRKYDREAAQPISPAKDLATLNSPSEALDGLSIKNMGADVNYAKDALEELRARIFAGASKVELGFTSADKGWKTQGRTTPEVYDKEERQALRELAKANEIQLSVHSTVGVGGYSGLGEGGFSHEARQKSVIELKRAIDFSAEVAGGGPIVAHMGEWSRPIYRAEGDKFTAFKDESQKGLIHLANMKTGQITTVRRDMEVVEPIIEGYDEKTRVEKYKVDEDGIPIVKKKTFSEIVEEEKKRPGYESGKLSDEELFISHYFRAQIENARAEAYRFGPEAKKAEQTIKKIDKALEFYKKVEAAVSEEEKWKLKQEFMDRQDLRGLVPPDVKTPVEFLEERRKELEYERKSREELARSYYVQAKEKEENMKELKPIDQVGMKYTADSLSDAALYALEIEKKKKTDRPIWIAAEHIFPEQYGGHPAELKNIIVESRKAMADKLKKKGYSESEAMKTAESHLRATIDMGHMNTWKKYFSGSDEEFKKWCVNQVEDLAKNGIIGHVHITDNFGYYDEHLPAGKGNTPIKEMLEVLKKYNVDKDYTIMIEGQGTTREWLGAMDNLSNPIYSGGPRWGDIRYQGSRSQSPYFVLNAYVPINQFVPWLKTPFE